MLVKGATGEKLNNSIHTFLLICVYTAHYVSDNKCTHQITSQRKNIFGYIISSKESGWFNHIWTSKWLQTTVISTATWSALTLRKYILDLSVYKSFWFIRYILLHRKFLWKKLTRRLFEQKHRYFLIISLAYHFLFRDKRRPYLF